MSALILIGASTLNVKYVLTFRYETGINVYFEGSVYEYSTCEAYTNSKDYLILTIVTSTIGVWIPMLLIIIVHILMYLELKKQAEIRRRSSSQDSSAQLTQISQTFTIILILFYICYLPYNIRTAVQTYFRYINKIFDADA